MPVLPLKKAPSAAVAFSLYSSGSTGNPKGVLGSHARWVASILTHEEGLAFTHRSQGDVVALHMPFAHESGMMSLTAVFYHGFSVVLLDGFSVSSFLSAVQRHRITYSYISPAYLVKLTKEARATERPGVVEVTGQTYNTSSLASVITSGSSCPAGVAEPFLQLFPFVARFVQCYGMTEAGMITCVDDEAQRIFKTVGRPVRGVRIKIVDPESGQTLAANSVGEILIDTPDRMTGYFKRPDADAEVFADAVWIRSGDVGFFDDDGLIYLVDRFKEVIKVDGLQVAPTELEALLVTEASVGEAAVVGIPDEERGEVPRAFVVLRDASGDTKREAEGILSRVNQQVAPFKRIKELVLLSSLPKIGIGKIDRSTLKRSFDSLSVLTRVLAAE